MRISANSRGARQLSRNLRQLDAKVDRAIKAEMKQLVQPVVIEVQARMPKRTGRAAASVKPTVKGANPAVRLGGAPAPYAGWLEFGGGIPAGGRRGRRGRRGLPLSPDGRYLLPTAERHRDRMVPKIESTMSRFFQGEMQL